MCKKHSCRLKELTNCKRLFGVRSSDIEPEDWQHRCMSYWDHGRPDRVRIESASRCISLLAKTLLYVPNGKTDLGELH